MHAKRLLILITTITTVLLPLTVAAQLLPPHRSAGPKPKLTPAVEQTRRERTPFRVEAGDVQLPLSVDNSRERFFPPLINQTGGSCARAKVAATSSVLTGVEVLMKIKISLIVGTSSKK